MLDKASSRITLEKGKNLKKGLKSRRSRTRRSQELSLHRQRGHMTLGKYNTDDSYKGTDLFFSLSTLIVLFIPLHSSQFDEALVS